MTKTEGSGSIIQRHGSADPYPYQNVTDPQYRFDHIKKYWSGFETRVRICKK